MTRDEAVETLVQNFPVQTCPSDMTQDDFAEWKVERAEDYLTEGAESFCDDFWEEMTIDEIIIDFREYWTAMEETR
jgi:hypothetical protein